MALAGNTARNNAVRDLFVSTYPAGSVIEYRNGAVPAATAAATGTLIATITLPASPWDSSVDSVASKAAGATLTTTTTLAGTPTYGRIRNAGNTQWSQFVVGTDGTASAVATNGDAYTVTAISITFAG